MKIAFKPSKCEGIEGVNTVEVYPDQLVILLSDRKIKFHFSSVAQWPKPALLFKLLSKIGIWPDFLPVADRDWFTEASNDRYFEFYTRPPIRVYIPDSTEMDSGETLFTKVRNVIESGRYSSFDLG